MTTALRELTRDGSDDILALEELWRAPAAEPARAAPRRRLPDVPGPLLAAGWLVFLVVALGFAPDPEPGMVWPAWALAASLGMYALLALGSFFAVSGLAAAGFGSAALAGAVLVPLAVNCRAAEHHLGNWWLAELGAAIALTGLAAAGYAQRRGR
ncbi:MAG TPA: hypothetical protein VK915_04935 [Gaiellaceae bacterium]|nr:hypothetical protein [Gaiellaceae bacterium]